jgi:hypothetical protein
MAIGQPVGVAPNGHEAEADSAAVMILEDQGGGVGAGCGVAVADGLRDVETIGDRPTEIPAQLGVGRCRRQHRPHHSRP